MNRHELFEPEETPPAETVGASSGAKPNTAKAVEIKVVAATGLTLLASVAYAVLNAVAAQPDVLAPWPPVWRFVTLAAIPPLLTFVAGYAVPSNRV